MKRLPEDFRPGDAVSFGGIPRSLGSVVDELTISPRPIAAVFCDPFERADGRQGAILYMRDIELLGREQLFAEYTSDRHGDDEAGSRA